VTALLVLFLASFLAASLARQRFFDSLSFARLQVERVTLYFLDDVLGLYLPFKPAKRVFKRFTFLKSNFSQRDYTPLPVLAGLVQLCQATPSEVKGNVQEFTAASKIQSDRHLHLSRGVCAGCSHEVRRSLKISRIVDTVD
jgi:hypothetical protein